MLDPRLAEMIRRRVSELVTDDVIADLRVDPQYAKVIKGIAAATLRAMEPRHG